MTSPPWERAPERLAAAPGVVDLHRIPLDAEDDRVSRFRSTLAPDELARADRFVFERDRRRFTVARGSLRSILARYLAATATELVLVEGEHGKPALAGGFAATSLRFNISHSDELGLLAVTDGREIGVDVERIRDDLDHEALAARWFTPAERADIEAHPVAEARLTAFFRAWTGKEAFIKANGEAVATSLARFDLRLAPGASLGLAATRPDPTEASRWTLVELTAIAPGFAAALAIEGTLETTRRFAVE